jgi:hypothetical protein
VSADWGRRGSATDHQRYSVERQSLRTGRRKCLTGGCQNPNTHAGYANGVCLMTGCQFHVAMWVKDPLAPRRKPWWVQKPSWWEEP